jgi:hypothetical protein
MQANYEIFFVWGNVSSFYSWPQVVEPSQPTTLSTPQQTCFLRKISPVTFAMPFDPSGKETVLLGRPWSSVKTNLGTTGSPTHFLISSSNDQKTIGPGGLLNKSYKRTGYSGPCP